MDSKNLKDILNKVSLGELTVDEAAQQIKIKPYVDLGYAKADTHRSLRHGVCEVIYGEGKTARQICSIVKALMDNGEKTVLITRVDKDKAEEIGGEIHIDYDEISRTALAGEKPDITGKGKIVVACAGTSDLYCAEEAAVTAEAFGNEVIRLYDVGVAGIHRLMDKTEEIMKAKAIIAVAGMEGALASVIGGLASCPVIAVPTSVGYGANFGGLSALLAMLNSCASNVSVVNIDNGFSAGYIANIINHQE